MVKLSDIIDIINPKKIVGTVSDKSVSKTIALDVVNEADDILMWVSEKNQTQLKEINHGVIICSTVSEIPDNTHCTYLMCDNPRLAFQAVLTHFFLPPREIGIAKSAIIHETVQLGENLFIGQNVVIEADCVIGDFVSINHNTVILKNTIIGVHVKIGCNSVIGSQGFGFEKDDSGKQVAIPHLGNVILNDDVEIGNNVCIDRAIMGSTILEKNVKLDNLVHIAHGVHIGENTLVIANATICGSVTVGKNCWIAPSATVLNKKNIGDNVTVGLAAVVMTNVPDNTIMIGHPADNQQDFNSKQFILKKLIKDQKLRTD